jgi:DNA-binding transcriptional MerR regulator
MFTSSDFENLKIIYHLVKERGFTLEGAKNKLNQNKEDTINNFEIVSRLKDIRNFLVELSEELSSSKI